MYEAENAEPGLINAETILLTEYFVASRDLHGEICVEIQALSRAFRFTVILKGFGLTLSSRQQ